MRERAALALLERRWACSSKPEMKGEMASAASGAGAP